MVGATEDWIGRALGGGRYRVLGRIGSGSMGQVFRAFDNNLQTEVVIKFPIGPEQGMPMPNLIERFSRETRSLVKLGHPHIVRIIDVGVMSDRPFVVMQYLTGGSLKERMQGGPEGEARPMDPASLRDWLLDVARALDFIHSQGHIHRDVKPANILFDAHGNAFIGDFGIIKALSRDEARTAEENSLTAPGFLLGTPSYVAPEIVIGARTDGRADQYSLALTVHEVLTGKNYLVGPSPSATIVNQTNIDPPPLDELLPGIPARLSRAIRRGMSKEPNDRFASCAMMAQEALAELPEAPSVREAAPERVPVGLVPCPSCRALIGADTRFVGEEVRCIHCGTISRVLPQDQTVQLRAVVGPTDATGPFPAHPSNVSFTEFSFAERPDPGTIEAPTPPPRDPSSNVSFTEFSFAERPRPDLADEATGAPPPRHPSQVSFTEFSFADRTGLTGAPAAPSASAPKPAGPPRKKGARGLIAAASALVVAGLLIAAMWPSIRGFWGVGPEEVRRSSAKPGGSAGSASGIPTVPGDLPEVVIAYGTEKEAWLKAALKDYEATPEGKRSHITLRGLGSLEGANLVLDGPGDRPIHVWSPASSAYRKLFEERWKAKHDRPAILEARELAVTPMVFVMWKDRHDAFVKKYGEVSFKTIGRAMAEPDGWRSIAEKPEWGLFKFAHTDPETSNSGFLALVLMAYEFRAKLRHLTVEDVRGEDFVSWLATFESRLTRPSGSLTASTGTLMKEMVNKGPSQFDCVLVYENLAIDSIDKALSKWGEAGSLQVIYADPNVWNDHPYYVLDVPWSSEAQRKEARRFLEFLMTQAVQERALDHGFRPGNPDVAVSFPESPLVKFRDHGVRLAVPRICEPPGAEVVTGLQKAVAPGR